MKQNQAVQNMEKKYSIVETFSSLSGEGSTSGIPASFIRVEGCNLRCDYCDTKYSYCNNFEKMSIERIIEELKNLNNKIVICTGGEPLFGESRDLPLLISNAGFKVYIETNGAVPLYTEKELIGYDRKKIHYVVDIKAPSSKMQRFDMLEQNAALLGDGDELKCVVKSDEDIKFCEDKLKRCFNDIKNKNINIILSPIFGAIQLSELANYVEKLKYLMEDSKLVVKLGIQLHKLIWPNVERGV